ncbi:hypothetical protein OH77DRAFT_453917 [Trametes cingulata]|nr:hypothetical protein OH77DRAFT_453917 [Trametes cingulata]
MWTGGRNGGRGLCGNRDRRAFADFSARAQFTARPKPVHDPRSRSTQGPIIPQLLLLQRTLTALSSLSVPLLLVGPPS